MFSATENAARAERIIKRSGEVDDLRDVLAVTAAPKRIIRVVVERDVENGTEVEIEPEYAEDLRGDLAVELNERAVALVAKLLRVRGFAADEFESGNSAAFLIDRDDRFDFRQVAQIVDEFAELSRAMDVPTEENKGAGLNAAEGRGGFGIEFGAGNADHDELASGRNH